jgi:hypothetical protein
MITKKGVVKFKEIITKKMMKKTRKRAPKLKKMITMKVTTKTKKKVIIQGDDH